MPYNFNIRYYLINDVSPGSLIKTIGLTLAQSRKLTPAQLGVSHLSFTLKIHLCEPMSIRSTVWTHLLTSQQAYASRYWSVPTLYLKKPMKIINSIFLVQLQIKTTSISRFLPKNSFININRHFNYWQERQNRAREGRKKCNRVDKA